MKVLTHFATDPGLDLRVHFSVEPEGGICQAKVDEIRAALQELGLAAEKLGVDTE